MAVVLHGYEYSVYAWIAGFCLTEKGVGYQWAEVNPFAADLDPAYLELNPFRRVPTLVHGDFVLHETGAILRYVDEAFDGPALQPAAPQARARVSQIIAIVDSYGYWPLVRQVFAQGEMAERMGREGDPAEVERGLAAAPRILGVLDRLAGNGPYLVGESLSLADIHLAPMVAYFTAASAGSALFADYGRLTAWWEVIRRRPAFVATTPLLPERQPDR